MRQQPRAHRPGQNIVAVEGKSGVQQGDAAAAQACRSASSSRSRTTACTSRCTESSSPLRPISENHSARQSYCPAAPRVNARWSSSSSPSRPVKLRVRAKPGPRRCPGAPPPRPFVSRCAPRRRAQSLGYDKKGSIPARPFAARHRLAICRQRLQLGKVAILPQRGLQPFDVNVAGDFQQPGRVSRCSAREPRTGSCSAR